MVAPAAAAAAAAAAAVVAAIAAFSPASAKALVLMLLTAFELVLAVDAEEPRPVGVLLADIELRAEVVTPGLLELAVVLLVDVVLVMVRLTGDLGVA